MVSERNEEIAIRRVIEDWASAVRARDINGVLAHHTDDVLMYDVPPPTAVRGISAYRETWPPFFKALAEGGAAFDIVELQIAAGDTVGFATALLRCGSKEELAKDPAPRLRLTISRGFVGAHQQGMHFVVASERRVGAPGRLSLRSLAFLAVDAMAEFLSYVDWHAGDSPEVGHAATSALWIGWIELKIAPTIWQVNCGFFQPARGRSVFCSVAECSH